MDDAIVVVENIHRRFVLAGKADEKIAAAAVDEVGNPTILATLAVIAALLPMAFVSGLMGPYMKPIPVGASAAMLFSLLVAFIVSPWLGYRLLRGVSHGAAGSKGRLQQGYEALLERLLQEKRAAAESDRRYWTTLGTGGGPSSLKRRRSENASF